MRHFHPRLVVALAALLAAPSMLPAQEVAFGGIELAASSIKGLTFVFQPGTEAAAQGAAKPERMKRLQYAERNAGFISMRDGCKLSAKGMDLLAKDTSEVVQELRDGAKANNLGTLHLFVVGSSGLGSVCNTDEVAAKVQQATGLCAEFISASDEAKYSLGFVLPRDRYRSLVLDINGGNTLGGYYVVTRGAAWPPREWHGMELPYGTRTLKDKALALTKTPQTDAQGNPLPPLDFYQAVDVVLHKEVQPLLDGLKDENSALENFSQVYLLGGSIWAISTRVKPVEQEEWAISTLRLADFDHVLAMVKDGTFNEFDGTEFGPHASSKTRVNAEGELQDVLQRFDPQTLYAGVSMMRFIIQQTTPSARLYFPTTAAWISGYAREKFREAGTSVPTCGAPVERNIGNNAGAAPSPASVSAAPQGSVPPNR
jgi:hypothetical protein